MFAGEKARCGTKIDPNFNLFAKDFKYPLFPGFNLGVGQNTESLSLSQTQLNNFGVENMSGSSLTSATLIFSFNLIGVSGWINLVQYVFRHSSFIPYFGIETRTSFFSSNRREASIQG